MSNCRCSDGFENFHVFIEGLHPRLGQTSVIRHLDHFLIRYIHTTIKNLDQYRVAHLVDPILADEYYEELNSRGVAFYQQKSLKDTFKSVKIKPLTDHRYKVVFRTNISCLNLTYTTKTKIRGLARELQQIVESHYPNLTERGYWVENETTIAIKISFVAM
jgi:hypothetical protein